MAVGIGLVFGVLRLVNFAYGQLVMAGAFALALALPVGLAGVGGHLALLRRRARTLGRDGPARLPAAARALAGGDARRDVRGRVPAPEHRAALVRLARARSPPRSRSSISRGRSRASTSARSRSSRSSSRPSACVLLTAAARADRDRPAHARGVDGLLDRTDARRAREPRHLVRRAPLRRARRGRRRDADRADAARDARLRAARHDRRARRRRRRRPEPADPGDARRAS